MEKQKVFVIASGDATHVVRQKVHTGRVRRIHQQPVKEQELYCFNSVDDILDFAEQWQEEHRDRCDV